MNENYVDQKILQKLQGITLFYPCSNMGQAQPIVDYICFACCLGRTVCRLYKVQRR